MKSLALAAALLASTAAHAEFTTAPPLPAIPAATEFSCYTAPAPGDRNPIAVTYVSISFDAQHKLSAMTVVHTMRSGDSYDRSQQYSGKVSQDNTGYYWSGWRGNVAMVGRLYYETNKRIIPHGWIYTEAVSGPSGPVKLFKFDCWPAKGEDHG